MKKLLFFFLLFSITTVVFAEGETAIKSEIKRVTVFRKGAQVSREASASIPGGIAVLKFINIAPNIEKQSIQLKAEGNFTVLSVTHQINYFEEPQKSAEVEQLLLQQKKLTEKMEEINLLLQVNTEEESLISSNKSIGGQQNGVLIQELKATADFYQKRLTEIKLKKLNLRRDLQAQQKELTQINAQLASLNASLGIYTSEVLVTINAAAPCQGNFSLSYLVKNAGWFPNYDIRVKDVQSPAKLNYKANVFQTSGEDWKNIFLTLSTGNPEQSGTKPELQPWLLRFNVPTYGGSLQNRRQEAGVYHGLSNGPERTIQGRVTDEYGEALIGASILVRGTTTGTVTDIDGKYTLKVPAGGQSLIYSYTGYSNLETAIGSGVMNVVLQEGIVLSEVVVTGLSSRIAGFGRGKRKQKSKGDLAAKKLAPSQAVPVQKQEKTTSVEFKINIPYSILTDGKQASVQIKKEEIPAYYEYYCVPKIDQDAFLTAQITDWESYDLLSGEVNLFFEGTYLGKSYLDVDNLEDTLNISLGRDKNIIVERTRQKEFTKKQFIGNKRTDSRAWEIEIRNKKKQPINLVVEDQFPISTNDAIEVDRESYDGAKLEEDTGKLVWKMNLAPADKKTLNFKYSVKYPKKQRLQLE